MASEKAINVSPNSLIAVIRSPIPSTRSYPTNNDVSALQTYDELYEYRYLGVREKVLAAKGVRLIAWALRENMFE
jgi:hypothetical protein